MRADARGQAGRRADPVRGRAGWRDRAGHQAPAARPRRVGHGDAATAIDEAVKRNVFARSLKREVRVAGRPCRREVERLLRGRRARCAGDRPQGRPGRDRLRQAPRRRLARDAGRRRSCMPRTAPRTGSARSRRLRPRRQGTRKRRRNPDHLGVYVGAIGFGIGAVKCDTCCPARRPCEQRVPCALPEPRTLPDRSIRTDEARR